ncbi:SepM family pheromone-processing serine protease [Salirhabdus salicampi]|uniref:SepM family pheromone-processing serine protease n=1 Tax=Salirhabdus salicampi TaxID=476102 RepID=UPI0020C3E0C3|nr:SepM family pheromone-processing serine protease [Salirhabdus salicampi]MCP8616622.1 PDZ domain-containing protein [Salirhabdus salicampi]
MKNRIRSIALTLTILALVFIVTNYRLPFYVYQPGDTAALDDVVQVDNGNSSQGDMHLVTVRGGQATPLYYLWAKFKRYYHIYPIDEVRPEGMSQKEYLETQLHYMESSQQAAKIVAYEAAGKTVDIEYNGVYVLSVMDEMPANDILKMGDRIIEVDNRRIEQASDMIDYVSGKGDGETVQITFIRDDEEQVGEVAVAPFPHAPDKVGIGISLVTDRNVNVEPPIDFDSGKIGGPSAGLMFALEIYDQLTEEDITRGYKIAGTGEIGYDGTVGRIGGIDKKIVAAHYDEIDVFFAPNEGGQENSNYEVARRVAQEIGTDMKVIPVDHFEDALQFLNELQ